MQKITRIGINAFLERYATKEQVLDIGSGGADQDSRFPNRTTFDIDPTRNPEIVGDIHDMPFPDNSYHTILCSEVLEHLHDPRKAIAQMYRVLAPGGTLVITTRFTFPVHDAPGDYWRFTPNGLRILFADFEIIDEAVETDTFTTIAVLLQRVIFQTKLRGGRFTKGILWLLMMVFKKVDSLVLAQYGDIQRKTRVETLLSSGVYLACTKK
jgi:SAM-dependent methyltransferase